MKRMKLVIIGVIVAIIAVPLAVYAAFYAGDRVVTVSFDVELVEVGEVCVSNLDVESEAMGLFSWYDTLRGHAPSRVDLYGIFVSLNQSGDVQTLGDGYTLIVDEPQSFEFKFYEMRPGETTLRIYIEYGYADAVVYDYTWTVNVG